MAQTDAEKRAYKLAYMRGYNRARARSHDLWQRLACIARGYRDRLKEPIMQRRCGDCARWSRGASMTLWGFCRADFDGEEPRMWAESFVGEREQRNIVTQEAFGCVNWLPRCPSPIPREEDR